MVSKGELLLVIQELIEICVEEGYFDEGNQETKDYSSSK